MVFKSESQYTIDDTKRKEEEKEEKGVVLSHPATSLKPLFPVRLSPSVSTTMKGSYFLTCITQMKIMSISQRKV